MTIVDNNEMQGIGWDDEISIESSFTVLPAGEYPFVVTNFERKIYEPAPGRNSKIPAGINQAVLELTFTAPDGETAVVTENLYLYKKMEWKISDFFIGIGQKKKGEPFNPNWNKVLGSHGMAVLEVNQYTKRDNTQGENNRVKNYLEPGNTQPAAQPVTPFPGATQPQQGGYSFS